MTITWFGPVFIGSKMGFPILLNYDFLEHLLLLANNKPLQPGHFYYYSFSGTRSHYFIEEIRESLLH